MGLKLFSNKIVQPTPDMIKFPIAIFCLSLIAAGCSRSDAQREFEQQALSIPENITGMTEAGKRVPDSNDPDDWRISPMYRGLIAIDTPAYPNPVNINSILRIIIDNKGFETLSGLEVFVYRDDPRNQLGPVYINDEPSITPGLLSIQLDPRQFSPFGNSSQASGLYRLIIYDGRRNIVSYGDVRVL